MSCIFCKVASGEIPAKIVRETESYVAFRDINPQAPTHILVIPKKHFENLAEVEDPSLTGELLKACTEVAKQEGLSNGFRVVINSGPDAGQTVFHLHLHILGGRSMDWPPG